MCIRTFVYETDYHTNQITYKRKFAKLINIKKTEGLFNILIANALEICRS